MHARSELMLKGALVGLSAMGTLLASSADAGPPAGNRISVCKHARHCDYTTIQAAIDSAVSGDRIDVGRGTYVENLVISKNQSIDIVGASPRRTTIEAATDGSPVVDVVCNSTGPVRIRIANVTITGGKLTSSKIKEAAGAGVSNQGCDLTLFDTVVTGNTVVGSGADLHNAFGGGIANRLASKLTLRDTTVIANSITGVNVVALGAGLYNDGTLEVIDSLLSSNRATPATGATFFRGQGGGLFSTIGSAIIKDSRVTDNAVEAAGAVSAGGGIVNTVGSMQILGSNIARNSAGEGGGMYMEGTVLLDDSSVRRNVATVRGGGVFVTGTANLLGAGTLNINYSNINRNVADGTTVGSGGGIFTEEGGVVNAVDATIRANAPDNCAGGFAC